MQQTMHSYVCGIIGGQKVLSFCQIYNLRKLGVPDFDSNVFIARKVDMT